MIRPPKHGGDNNTYMAVNVYSDTVFLTFKSERGARPFKNHYSKIGTNLNWAEIFEKKIEIPSFGLFDDISKEKEFQFFFSKTLASLKCALFCCSDFKNE